MTSQEVAVRVQEMSVVAQEVAVRAQEVAVRALAEIREAGMADGGRRGA